MKKSWLIIVAIVLAAVLIALVVKIKFFGKPARGALSVSTTPKATVFLDGSQVGTTPFLDDKIEVGEHLVKLVPESSGENLVAWEGKVKLSPNILTVINRTFGLTDADGAGETLWLEKIGTKDKSALAVVSIPDQAVVKVDGEPKGFSPVLVEDLNPGSYQIVIASPGYEERLITAKTVAGYKLIINAQLARKIDGIEESTPSAEAVEVSPTPSLKTSPSPKATPKPTVAAPEKPYVRIKETPTGWLRVRLGPSASATEAAKLDTGETRPYLNEKENGWYKIEYETSKEGWVSSVYADLVE